MLQESGELHILLSWMRFWGLFLKVHKLLTKQSDFLFIWVFFSWFTKATLPSVCLTGILRGLWVFLNWASCENKTRQKQKQTTTLFRASWRNTKWVQRQGLTFPHASQNSRKEGWDAGILVWLKSCPLSSANKGQGKYRQVACPQQLPASRLIDSHQFVLQPRNW